MPLVLDGTNGVSGVDGTAASPAIEGTDSNTGIFFPAADTIAFAEGGTEVARFDSSGNFGIGTSSPLVPLHVVSTGTSTTMGGNVIGTFRSTAAGRASTIQLSDGTNPNFLSSLSGAFGFGSGGTEQMRIDSSGNVGIGTSSPITRLHVLDSLTGGQFIVANSETNSSTKYGSFGTQHYTNTEEPALCIAMESASTENNVLIGGALGDFNAATTIKFYTAANNTTVGGTERARIDSSGNLLQTGVTTASGVLMSGLGSGSSNSTTNSATYNVTINGSAKVFWVFTANGDGCLVVTNYTTTTITILGTGGVIVASASPASNQLGISKSANSHVVTFKTGSAASTTYGSWGVGSLSSSVA